VKNIYKTLLLFVVICLLSAKGYAQVNTSNKGTNFWLGYMQNIRGVVIANNTICQLDVYITSDVSTTGTITFADGVTSAINFTVTANQVTPVVIPQSQFLSSAGQFLKGINITSVQPIVVFAHIHAAAVSGATLVLPINTLGKDYYSLNYTQVSNEAPSYSAFVVVATEDTTVVQITPTATLTTGQAANTSFTLNLKKGELFQGLSSTDLTGTRIQSISTNGSTCKKIAVFSGSSKIMIGCFSNVQADNTADNLFQQVYPTASWGKNYYTAPLKNRDYDIYRIALSDPTTTVTLNGVAVSPSQFVNGFYYEFSSSSPNIIQADKPIQVIQYAVTQGKMPNSCNYDNNDVGDPEMIFLTPIEQTIKQATLYSTPKENILAQYINVIIKTTDASSFIIDGVNKGSGFTAFTGDPTYAYGQFTVAAGTHNISASGGFNAIAYGFGQFESYGYAAGANLQDLNEYIQYTNPTTHQVVTSGCTAQNFNSDVTLPFATTKLTWDLKNGSPTYTDSSPTPIQITTKGTQTLYTYQYPTPVSYSTAGTYVIKVIAFNPIADACGSDEEVDMSFDIINPPVAKFSSRTDICFADTIQFHDQTNGLGHNIAAWHWDFGDGDTSAVQNPIHTYVASGNFTVTLVATGSTGCIGMPYQQNVHVEASPVAAFAVSQPDCETRTVTFTDQSTSAERPITQWVYDFGDGSALQTQATNSPFTHTFSNAGTYAVKLYNITDKGCAGNTVTKNVVVNPLPVVKPILPDICLTDGTAQFTDSSTIADNSQAQFTYLWNFGDAASTAGNPNTSTAKNPSHYYNSAGPYNMSLTVTSKDGCSVKKDTVFTVNGSNPKAGLIPLNPTQLCSDHEVFFVNNSTVTPGSITKIEIYYDAGDATSLVTYNHPTLGQIFRHSYPVFYTGTKIYTVHMIAYSGTKCSNPLDITITLLPVPVLSLPALAPVCVNAGLVNLVATETQGPPGPAGIFSGAGVSGTTFNPALAGVGTHTLTYIFTPNNLCADTVTRTITVNPLPVVTVGPDTSVLAGHSIRIVAAAVGDSLSYKWTPSIGLSADNVLNPIASPASTTTYTLTVTGRGVCSDTASIKIKVLLPPIVPNTFTPNNDGINDTWNITNLSDYSNCTVEVYNRNGSLLFSSIGYGKAWDGRYNGAPLPIGTYYYIINPKHGRSVISGYITILR
jgi:gliding motility-associated-like protein